VVRRLTFVRSFVIAAGVQPILDPRAETISKSSALVHEKGGELVGVCECVRDVQGTKVK